jgi:hypothetical protein
MAGVQTSINEAITSDVNNTTSGSLFLDEQNLSLPFGVYSGKNKSSFSLDTFGTKNLDLITQSVLNRMGEKSSYLFKKGLITGADIMENATLRKFVSPHSKIAINNVENSHGFRALSRQSIERITGIKGYDIYEMIDALRSIESSIHVEDDERTLFGASLDTIIQKLKIEQNMRDIGNRTETEFISKMMLRYGPDVTSMVFGVNLNTASLLNEGFVGSVVGQLYGGNTVRFLYDVLGGVIQDWFGNLFLPHASRLKQRGYARNFLSACDQASQAAKMEGVLSDNMVKGGKLTRTQKYRGWRRDLNATVYKRLNGALVNQAQLILVKALNNGDLRKVKGIFGRDESLAPGITAAESMNNQDHLKRDLKKAKVRKINAHYAYIMRQAGLLEGNRLEIYAWMLKNIKSTHIRNGTLDLTSAQEWIESYDWNNSKLFFGKEEALQTVKAMYDTLKSYRDVSMVDSNPWDANTHTGSVRIVAAIFKQYPNIWVNQHLVRRGALMGHKDMVAALLTAAIGDCFYNLMLLVATGFLAFKDLLFWEKESKLNQNPLILSNLILSRNPIFGLPFSMVSQLIHQILMQQQRQAERIPQQNINDIKNTQGIVGDISEGLMSSGSVPATAVGMVMKSLSAIYTASITEGNMNEEETYDFKRAIFSLGNFIIPGMGELPLRLLLNELFLGSRPEKRPQRSVGSSPFVQRQKPLINRLIPKEGSLNRPDPSFPNTDVAPSKSTKPTKSPNATSPEKAPEIITKPTPRVIK